MCLAVAHSYKINVGKETIKCMTRKKTVHGCVHEFFSLLGRKFCK